MFLTDKFCYISISRTGTRSVLNELDKLLTENLIKYDINSFHMMNNLFKGAKLPFTFTFVRNPYDRSLSIYNHAIKNKWFTGSFIEYLETVNSYFTDPTRNKHKDKVNGQEGFINIIQVAIPQYYYLFKEDGSTNVDFIGRYERLNEDWDKLCTIFKTKLNLNLDNKLPLLNERPTSISYDYENRRFGYSYIKNDEYDNDNVRKLIYKIYKKDFELLNYNKDKLVQCKKNINFKLEKKLNDDFFDLYEIMNKNPQSEKIPQMIEELFKYILESLEKKGMKIMLNENIKYLKSLKNNGEKIHCIVSLFQREGLHILPKYIVN